MEVMAKAKRSRETSDISAGRSCTQESGRRQDRQFPPPRPGGRREWGEVPGGDLGARTGSNWRKFGGVPGLQPRIKHWLRQTPLFWR
jgi:hypothetical protein